MDKVNAGYRDRDPIEHVLFFLLKNWILLVSLPVTAGIIAFALTVNAPPIFTANIRIPAPPIALVAFDNLWNGRESPYDTTISADGSVLISSPASSEQEARAPLVAVQAATLAVAAEAIAAAEIREAKLSDMETLLLNQVPASNAEAQAPQAYALAIIIQVAESARQKTRTLHQWSRTLQKQEVTISRSTSSNLAVPFSVFGGFTLALAVAIARRLLSRRQDDGKIE